MAKGEDARRKLKQAFPDLETSNAQNRCKFTTSFGFKIAFGKVGHPRHGASTSAFFFQFQKKKGPARYQIPCSCHSRPAAEVPEGDPEAEAGPPEEKPGPHQDFVAKNILLPQIIVDAEARQILGGASGAKSSPGVRLLTDPDLGGVEKFGNAASSALSTLAHYKPAIGTGGSAIVYRGDYSGGEVAVKIPRPEYRVVVCSGRI